MSSSRRERMGVIICKEFSVIFRLGLGYVIIFGGGLDSFFVK